MIGQPAPQFTAPAVVDGGEFKDVSLSDYKGKWVVLYFYPLDFTFVCPTEITQFRDYLPKFKEANAQVLGCSVDSVHSHKRWIKDDLKDLNYPLIGDVTKRVSRDMAFFWKTKASPLAVLSSSIQKAKSNTWVSTTSTWVAIATKSFAWFRLYSRANCVVPVGNQDLNSLKRKL